MIVRSNLMWMPCSEYKPTEAGAYLVITHGGYIRIDRWDGEQWGLCKPRTQIRHKDKGRYKLHKAWSYMRVPEELKGKNEV